MAVSFAVLEHHLSLPTGSIYDVRLKGRAVEVYIEHESLPAWDAIKLPPMIAKAVMVDSTEPQLATVTESELAAEFESDILAALDPVSDPHEHEIHRLDDDGAPHPG